MDEGWSRWVFESTSNEARNRYLDPCDTFHYTPIQNADIVSNRIKAIRGSSRTTQPGAIVFPDQSPAQILNGYAKGSMPDEYVGGVGKEGVANLRKFVENGGTLVFLNRSSQFAIEQFNLPIKDVTRGLNRKDFYIPGSILRTELDLTHPIAKGMPKESIAWFGGPGENSPAFEIINAPAPPTGVDAAEMKRPTDISDVASIRVIARYPTDPKQILLSGWALGSEKIAGKAALVEVTIGKGKIVLFGFRPQYRGQSLATFPLLFNAISQ